MKYEEIFLKTIKNYKNYKKIAYKPSVMNFKDDHDREWSGTVKKSLIVLFSPHTRLSEKDEITTNSGVSEYNGWTIDIIRELISLRWLTARY